MKSQKAYLSKPEFQTRTAARPSASSARARIGPGRHSRWFAALCFAAFAATSAAVSGAGSVTYAYDELGRLIAVVDNSSGNAAQYIYDAVGNLQQIKNTNGSTVSIFTFTPNDGGTGLSVTIYGDGFSTTPSSNTVTFYNGKTAVVTASTLSTITTTVPTGAATGPIKVTSPNGTATSSTIFRID